MATITQTGQILRHELNEALRTDEDRYYIPLARLDDVSLLARRCKSHRTRCENECSYEWANTEKYARGTERLENSIRELATSFPGIDGVRFYGDPRGYTVRLLLATGRSNTWGGDGEWGV